MEELFELFNEDGTRSGVLKKRSEVHRDGDLHGAVHMWIYRIRGGRGEILIQKRSECKDSWPGCYDISSAGHLDPGEDFKDAALREMKEELGLNVPAEELHFLKEYRVEDKAVFRDTVFHNREIIQLYIYDLEDDNCRFSLQAEEVSEVKWVEMEELLEAVKTNTIHHCIVADNLEMVVKEIRKML